MRTNRDLIHAYYKGMCDGVSLYAHWKDGVQYVGTTGKTLKEAIKTINEEMDKTLKSLDQDERDSSLF